MYSYAGRPDRRLVRLDIGNGVIFHPDMDPGYSDSDLILYLRDLVRTEEGEVIDWQVVNSTSDRLHLRAVGTLEDTPKVKIVQQAPNRR